MIHRTTLRKAVNNLMLTLTGLCTILTVSMLFLILGFLLWNGWRSLDWNFFTKLPLSAGETGGGMANSLVGSAVFDQHPRIDRPRGRRRRCDRQRI